MPKFDRGRFMTISMYDVCSFLGRALDWAGHPVSFWAHVNLHRVVSYNIRCLYRDKEHVWLQLWQMSL